MSVIVPVHSGGESLVRCLDALLATSPSPHEIIVVADGDAEAARVAEERGVRVVRLPVCRGAAHARNQGAAVAGGDILFFVDADVTVPSDTIQRVATFFAEHEDVSAVIGSYDDEPDAKTFLSQYKNLLHHYVHQTSNEEAQTFWGACGAIRRRAFLDVGGFDDNFTGSSIEDIAFGYRLKASGRRIRLEKTLQVKHLKRWDAVSLLRTDFYRRALPWTELALKYRRFPNDLNLRWSSRISVAACYGACFSMLAAIKEPQALWVALALLLVVLSLNSDVYTFFLRKRGFTFTVGAVSWHCFYYLYSGLAFAVGTFQYILSGARHGRATRAADVNCVK